MHERGGCDALHRELLVLYDGHRETLQEGLVVAHPDVGTGLELELAARDVADVGVQNLGALPAQGGQLREGVLVLGFGQEVVQRGRAQRAGVGVEADRPFFFLVAVGFVTFGFEGEGDR